jgi:GNAT superfamily N-acetyltransferase
MKVTLLRLSRKSGKTLFSELWPESDLPPMSTKWYEVRQKDEVVGWVAAQYKSRRIGRERHVIIHGLYVKPEFRGKNLQVVIRNAAVAECRPKGSTSAIQVLTYVSAENIASLRNVIKSGALPYEAFKQGSSTFIKFQGKI